MASLEPANVCVLSFVIGRHVRVYSLARWDVYWVSYLWLVESWVRRWPTVAATAAYLGLAVGGSIDGLWSASGLLT